MNNRDWKKDLKEDEERELLALKKRVWHVAIHGLLFMFSVYGIYALVISALRLFHVIEPQEASDPNLFYRIGFGVAAGWILHSFIDGD